MTTLLAIDCSTENCTVGILHKKSIKVINKLGAKQHTQLMLPIINQLLAECQLSLHNFDAIAFGRGPGSFTGVRIGASVTQGLAFATDLPVIPVSTLTSLVYAGYRHFAKTNIVAAIDARMNQVYASQQQLNIVEGKLQRQELINEQVIDPNKLLDLISITDNICCVGTGWQNYPMLQTYTYNQPNQQVIFPDAHDLLVIAEQELNLGNLGNIITADKIEPIYLRDEVAWQKQ